MLLRSMAIQRLNHAVLFVRDADASAGFYERVLDFRRIGVDTMPGAVFMQAPDSTNDHDLGLFSIGAEAAASAAGRGSVGLYHLAWEVDTLDALGVIQDRLSAEGALVGATNHGTTKSVYGRDVDGLEFEVAWIVPAALLDEAAIAGRSQLRRLDLEVEKERYGASTQGGTGISHPHTT